MNEYDRNIPYIIREDNNKYIKKIDFNDKYISYLLINNRVIIDTNCFVHNLSIIKQIIKINKIDIVIPLVVIKELKGLLRKKGRKKEAHEALQLINSLIYKENVMFQKKNGVYCIDCKKYEEGIIFNEVVKNLDDIIIDLCKINKEVLSGKSKLFLLTSDLILKIKAESNEIHVINIDF